MTQFHPYVGMPLRIGAQHFEFIPHPLFPQDSEAVSVLEGAEALIYQVRDVVTQSLYALKVMKPAYRSGHLIRVSETISYSVHIPGFHIPHRICLTMTEYPDLIRAYPDLEYAVLMSWFTGKTWSGFMQDQTASASYTREQAYTLATMVANLLQELESLDLVHSDIAGGNILLSPDLQSIQLLDLEGLYMPGVTPPPHCSQGSPGYQHRNLGPRGQWCPEGDRFAGAILLTEILTWCNPRVRAYVADYAESLFQATELQTDDLPSLPEVRKTLWSIHSDLLSLFDQAWSSYTLSECPKIEHWYRILSSFRT